MPVLRRPVELAKESGQPSLITAVVPTTAALSPATAGLSPNAMGYDFIIGLFLTTACALRMVAASSVSAENNLENA